jgi:hypothetical protein
VEQRVRVVGVGVDRAEDRPGDERAEDRLEPEMRGQGAQATTSSTDSRTRIGAEVSASLLIILVIHMERSMRSVPSTSRTTRTPSGDSSSSLGPRAVARPEKNRDSKMTGLSSPSEAPAIANWPTGRSATPASSRIGMVGFDQVQYRAAEHDPGDDLQHRPGDPHPRHGREDQRHRRDR